MCALKTEGRSRHTQYSGIIAYLVLIGLFRRQNVPLLLFANLPVAIADCLRQRNRTMPLAFESAGSANHAWSTAVVSPKSGIYGSIEFPPRTASDCATNAAFFAWHFPCLISQEIPWRQEINPTRNASRLVHVDTWSCACPHTPATVNSSVC